MFQTKCSSASTLSQTVRFETNRGSPPILVSVLPVPGSPEPSIIQTNPGIRLPEPLTRSSAAMNSATRGSSVSATSRPTLSWARCLAPSVINLPR